MTFELYGAAAVAGVAVLYGGFKATQAAASATSHKTAAMMRDMKTSSNISAHKKEMNQSAKERKKRIAELTKKK
jgi:DNA phosphorothioation-dependent restriction protein DptG